MVRAFLVLHVTAEFVKEITLLVTWPGLLVSGSASVLTESLWISQAHMWEFGLHLSGRFGIRGCGDA